MYRIVLLCWIFFPLFGQGQHLLPGLLTYQNSGDSAVVGAEVSALWANSTLSDESGRFALRFTGKGPGYQAELTVIKPGYEVVNKKELRHTLKADLRRPLKLYLCPEGQWERNAVKYYQINEEQITRRYREELAAVKRQLQDDQRRLTDSLQRMEELYRFALSQAQRLAEQFAIANLDDADSLYRAAFEQFTQGNIGSAINILADDLLDANMSQAQQQKAEADTLLSAGQAKLAQAEAARRVVAQEFFLRWRSKRALDRADAFKDLERAFQLDSNRVEIRQAYAQSLIQKDPIQAAFHFRWLLDHGSLTPRELWWQLGMAYYRADMIDEATLAWKEAVKWVILSSRSQK